VPDENAATPPDCPLRAGFAAPAERDWLVCTGVEPVRGWPDLD
jgi:hypothetical protein